MDIRATVTGTREVELTVGGFPDHLYDALRADIDDLGQQLLAAIQGSTPVKTGQLRAAERLREFADARHIAAVVDVAASKGSAAFGKAAALEYGAHRATAVRGHAMRLDHAWGDKLAAPITVMVEAYTRTPDIAEHAFERGPLAALAPAAVARLQATVARVVGEANA